MSEDLCLGLVGRKEGGREGGREGGNDRHVRTLSPCSSLILPGASASSRCRRLACSFSALLTSLCRVAASAFWVWMLLSSV
jgi:hypothetical protein